MSQKTRLEANFGNDDRYQTPPPPTQQSPIDGLSSSQFLLQSTFLTTPLLVNSPLKKIRSPPPFNHFTPSQTLFGVSSRPASSQSNRSPLGGDLCDPLVEVEYPSGTHVCDNQCHVRGVCLLEERLDIAEETVEAFLPLHLGLAALGPGLLTLPFGFGVIGIVGGTLLAVISYISSVWATLVLHRFAGIVADKECVVCANVVSHPRLEHSEGDVEAHRKVNELQECPFSPLPPSPQIHSISTPISASNVPKMDPVECPKGHIEPLEGGLKEGRMSQMSQIGPICECCSGIEVRMETQRDGVRREVCEVPVHLVGSKGGFEGEEGVVEEVYLSDFSDFEEPSDTIGGSTGAIIHFNGDLCSHNGPKSQSQMSQTNTSNCAQYPPDYGSLIGEYMGPISSWVSDVFQLFCGFSCSISFLIFMGDFIPPMMRSLGRSLFHVSEPSPTSFAFSAVFASLYPIIELFSYRAPTIIASSVVAYFGSIFENGVMPEVFAMFIPAGLVWCLIQMIVSIDYRKIQWWELLVGDARELCFWCADAPEITFTAPSLTEVVLRFSDAIPIFIFAFLMQPNVLPILDSIYNQRQKRCPQSTMFLATLKSHTTLLVKYLSFGITGLLFSTYVAEKEMPSQNITTLFPGSLRFESARLSLTLSLFSISPYLFGCTNISLRGLIYNVTDYYANNNSLVSPSSTNNSNTDNRSHPTTTVDSTRTLKRIPLPVDIPITICGLIVVGSSTTIALKTDKVAMIITILGGLGGSVNMALFPALLCFKNREMGGFVWGMGVTFLCLVGIWRMCVDPV